MSGKTKSIADDSNPSKSKVAKTSNSSEELLMEIAALYPELDYSLFEEKMNSIHSDFFFLRTCVPYYYSHFSKFLHTKPLPLVIEALMPYGGWCAGDPHLENFGASLNDDGDALFSINDFDDAGHSLLVADALRFFTSVILGFPGTKEEDLQKIVDSYTKGLIFDGKFKDIKYKSKVVEDLLIDAEKFGWDPKKNAVDDPTEPTKLVIPSTSEDGHDPRIDRENNPTWDNLVNTLKKHYGEGVDLIDAIQEDRAGGGSGGLNRFLTLVHIPKLEEGKKPKRVLIQFKQEPKPGVFPLVEALHGDVGSFTQRLPNTLEFTTIHGTASIYYRADTLSYLNEDRPTDYLLRPRFHSNRGVSLAEIGDKEEDKVHLARDEAFTLGLIHRKSADDKKEYIKAATAIDPTEWLAVAKEFAVTMTKAFNTIRNKT
eukprot:gene31108-40453_t